MRLLQAFTATSIPTGTMLLLMSMGSLGATPRVPLAAPEVEVQEEYWTALAPQTSGHLADTQVPALPEEHPGPSEVNRPESEDPAAAPLPKEPTPAAPKARAQRAEAGTGGSAAGGQSSEARELRVHPGRAERDALAAQGKGGRKCVEPVAGIREAGSDHWAVERSLLEAYAKDRDAASRLAMLTWQTGADGQVSGFRIGRLRCGSPLHQAGFRNGDVVHAVNGKPITSYAEAAWAYGVLRNQGSLKVKLTRKDGSPKRLRYTLE